MIAIFPFEGKGNIQNRERLQKIKRRSGAKTARVAVMRRLATIVWHMLRWEKSYQFRYDPPPKPAKTPNKDDLRSSGEVLGGIGNRDANVKQGRDSR